jgi:mannose/fructose/N-acetylgalactosamine-specific phosphotransferase system component IIC
VPPASLTVAVKVTVSLTEVRLDVLGTISTLAASCTTVIAEVAVKDPEVAVTVAVPFATAVTSPDEVTVATEPSDVDQAIDCPDIVAEF